MKFVLSITGMSCGGCVSHVSKSLASVTGVKSVDVDLAAGLAAIVGDQVSEAGLLEAVSDQGYVAQRVG